METNSRIWIEGTVGTVVSYRRLIDAAIGQLTDEELFASPQPGINSVATLLRHLGGNLISRWTDFLTTDGEKPTRNRDMEFEPWTNGRDSLLEYFDQGWSALNTTITSLTEEDLHKSIFIRGEAQTVPYAVMRAVTHIAYHVGQIMLVSRMVHVGDWNWLTIAPGASQLHNKDTWGSAQSRGTAGGDTESQ